MSKISRTNGITIPRNYLIAIIAGIVSIVGLASIPSASSIDPSTGLRRDSAKLSTTWTTINTEQCLTFSYYFAIELDKVGFPIANQPDAVRSSIESLAQTNGSLASVEFWSNKEIGNALLGAWTTMGQAIPSLASDPDLSAKTTECLMAGPFGNWAADWAGDDKLSKIWTRSESLPCMSFSYYFALELEKLRIWIAGQPNNLRDTMDDLGRSNGLPGGREFLNNAQMSAAVAEAGRKTLANPNIVIGSPSEVFAECLANGPIGDWWISDAP